MSTKARHILARGRAAVGGLPGASDLAARTPEKRHEVLERLRIELYAIASIIAEGAVERAYKAREERPPYGLVRSGHTDWRMVLDAPKTVEEGTLDSFYALGKAYVDTVVFHLDRQFAEMKSGDQGWMVARLEELLALFRIDAGPATKGRLRDGLSFIYGGLHFGTGVSVQLTEVMHRLLGAYSDLTAAERAEIVSRSSRPAHRLAALNFDHVIVAYHAFLAPPAAPGGPQWFDAERFVVHEGPDGRPSTIDFRPDQLVAGKPHTPRLDTVTTTWATHGCPARISPTGALPPITRLWTWCAHLALQADLLKP